MNARYVVLAAMGLGVSTAGCGQTPTDEDLAAMDIAAPRYQAQENPAGGGTNNHVRPFTYQRDKYKLLAAMGYGLGTKFFFNGSYVTTHTLSSNIVNTGVLDTLEGQDLFDVTVQCALAGDQYVQWSGRSDPFTGQGLMNTTASWFTGPLTTAQKEDVLRCVIARVNAFGLSVNIRISGEHVADPTGIYIPTYNWTPDALWDVRVVTNSSGSYTINEYAWPVANVISAGSTPATPSCPDNVMTAAEARICDSSPSCGFQSFATATTDCLHYTPPGSPDGYKCAYDHNTLHVRPVVESWVDSQDVLDFYPAPGCRVSDPCVTMNPASIPEAPGQP